MSKAKVVQFNYDADKLAAQYVHDDGSVLVRTDGYIVWRLNNPGNLRPPAKGNPIYKFAIGVAKTKKNGSFFGFPRCRVWP